MHESVLLHEAIDALAIDAEGTYIDGTFGRGGHSTEIVKKLSEKGRLWGFDKDKEAIRHAAVLFGEDIRFTPFHASFTDIVRQVDAADMRGKISGVLLDLGVSSPQIDTADRGFSFKQDGPLDMRMDNEQGESAADWLNRATLQDISWVLNTFGEERFARLIAKKIIERREIKAFTRTLDLADFIAAIIPRKFHQKKHPATRSFQAIRIHVNNELGDLEALLSDVLSVLKVGGRLVVISFHSLEDRLIKKFIKAQEKGPVVPRNIPLIYIKRDAHFISASKAVKPSVHESENNIRARSAILRVAEKVAGNA